MGLLSSKTFWIGFVAGFIVLELLNIFNPGNIMAQINNVFGALNPSKT